MSGGGAGGILADVAPMALLAIPGVGEALAPAIEGLGVGADAAGALSTGLIGAAASGGIGALTGSKNPLENALIGGLGAGLGSYALSPSGFGSASGDVLAGSNADDAEFGSAASNASGTAPLSSVTGSPDVNAQMSAGLGNSGSSGLSLGAGSTIQTTTADALGVPGGVAGTPAQLAQAASASPSILSQVGNYALKNPLPTALAGNIGLSTIQSLMPKPKVNFAANQAAVEAANPGFYDPNLPSYHAQNTATPYTGNWYTYGEQSQQPQFTSQIVPGAKRGGLIGYARGGPVKHYAMGGGVPPMPQAVAPAPMPQAPMAVAPMAPKSQLPINPLTLKVAHNVGVAIGKHLKSKMGHVGAGPVHGQGGGQADMIPAKLSDGEYVHSADVVAALGDGSTKEGGLKLKAMDAEVRAHKTSNGKGFPPRAKNPLAYLPKKSEA